jgi:hypothetical protein
MPDTTLTTSTTLPLDALTRDDRCQSRVAVDPNVVDDYADDMINGAVFPPVVVFDDEQTKWLADGFHRVAAARQAGLTEIATDLRSGTVRDAIVFSMGANITHGLRRTNADKQRVVRRLLDDPEWSTLADREIARRCGVSHPFAAAARQQLSGNGYQIPATRIVERGGSTFKMNVTRIGEAAAPEETERHGPISVPPDEVRRIRHAERDENKIETKETPATSFLGGSSKKPRPDDEPWFQAANHGDICESIVRRSEMEVQKRLDLVKEQGLDIPALMRENRRVSAEWNNALRASRSVTRKIREAIKAEELTETDAGESSSTEHQTA